MITIEPSHPLTCADPGSLSRCVTFFDSWVECAREAGRGSQVVVTLGEGAVIDAVGILLLHRAALLIDGLGCSARLGVGGKAAAEVMENIHHLYGKQSTGLKGSYYLLREVRSKDEMIGELRDWAGELQRKIGADPEIVAVWQTQMAEACTNSFQHGSPDRPIHIIGKQLDRDRFQLATLDSGVGIPVAIRAEAANAGVPLEDGALIRYSMKEGVSSRSVRQNQGLGLHLLAQSARRYQGRLQVASRNGLAHVTNGRIYSRRLNAAGNGTALEGTLIAIDVATNRKT